MAENEADAAQQEANQKIIKPKKLYLKDVSFETPNSPHIFTKKWTAEINVEFQISATEIDTDLYEVVIALTVTTSTSGETAYLAEVHQAGIFVMQGFDAEDLPQKQNVYCVRILYPFAAAAISDLVSRGGFPQLVLSPLNFAQIYSNRTSRSAEESSSEDSEETEQQQA